MFAKCKNIKRVCSIIIVFFLLLAALKKLLNNRIILSMETRKQFKRVYFFVQKYRQI